MPRDGATWRRFWLGCVVASASVLAALYLFTIVIDPWGALPLSPPLPRVPVTSLTRYSMPMLARDARFDAAVLGTSTSRLLRPVVLDRLLDAHFVNLAFNAATAVEQVAMLDVFLAAHPRPRFVLWGMDVRWCDPGPELMRLPDYEFPDWLYRRSRWDGYRNMLSLFALREAAAQALTMLGLKPLRHALDGYENFTIDEAMYDASRARARIAADGVMPGPPDAEIPAAAWPTVTLPRLEGVLARMPEATRVVLFFVPFALPFQGPADSPSRRYWAECKRRVVDIARRRPGTVVADFLRESDFTAELTHYLDGMHYRTTVADRLAEGLALAVAEKESPLGDHRLLLPELRSQ